MYIYSYDPPAHCTLPITAKNMEQQEIISTKRDRREESPSRDYGFRSKRVKVSYKAGDRVKAKWPGSVNERLYSGTIVEDTSDQCLIEFDDGHKRLTVQNINVQRLPEILKVREGLSIVSFSFFV